jgi:hypothetical protein
MRVQAAIKEMKEKYNKLRNTRTRKARQLKGLEERLKSLHTLPDTSVKQTAASIATLADLTVTEDNLAKTYNHMLRTRAVVVQASLARNSNLNALTQQINKEIKAKQAANILAERELEQLADEEAKFKAKCAGTKKEHAQRMQSRLKQCRGAIQVEVLVDRTRTRRQQQGLIDSQTKKLELLEELSSKLSEAESLEAANDKSSALAEALSHRLHDLKEVTHAQTVEDVVRQYEEVLSRQVTLKKLEADKTAEIEAREAELVELKQIVSELSPPERTVKDLGCLEDAVTYKEVSQSLPIADLRRLEITLAEATGVIDRLHAAVRRAQPVEGSGRGVVLDIARILEAMQRECH